MTLALGHCGVSSDSQMGDQMGVWSPQDLLQADRSLVFSGPTGISALGHCGIQFREMGVWPLRTHWGFGFGTLWGSA